MKSRKYPSISVVMLNYNGLKYLKRTIPPILKLDYPNYEFVIVDNGSNDGSIEFIKKFKKVRLIQSPKIREKNFACNYALKKARGKNILLLDNDILLSEPKILRRLLVLLSEPKIGSIGLALVNEKEKKTVFYGGFLGYYLVRENRKRPLTYVKQMNKQKIAFPHGGCLFIKKDTWNYLGGYDEDLNFGGDDNDLGIKLWLFGFENYLYSSTIQTHLGMPERKDTKKYSEKWVNLIKSHLYTIFKNYNIHNLLPTFLGFSLFAFFKSIKQSAFRLHPGPFLAFFQGYYLFLKNLPVALKKRKEIQSKRVIRDDIFLKIKPPKFD